MGFFLFERGGGTFKLNIFFQILPILNALIAKYYFVGKVVHAITIYTIVRRTMRQPRKQM